MIIIRGDFLQSHIVGLLMEWKWPLAVKMHFEWHFVVKMSFCDQKQHFEWLLSLKNAVFLVEYISV